MKPINHHDNTICNENMPLFTSDIAHHTVYDVNFVVSAVEQPDIGISAHLYSAFYNPYISV